MNKKILFGILSVLVIVGALALSKFFIDSKKDPKRDSNQHSVMFVQTREGAISDIDANMTYRGRANAFDLVSLASEVSSKLMPTGVRFKAGESFRKGDLIVKLYDEDVKASLMANKSSFLQTLSSILPNMKVDYADEYEKWQSFFNSIDVSENLPALPEANSNQERVFLAANNVLSSYYSLRQQEINLTRYEIRAPFDGAFKSVSKEIGAVASPSAELASITRTDKLEVTVTVFPEDLQWIKKGDKVSLIDRNNEVHTATVSRISSFVETSTQSVNVYLTYYRADNDNILEGEYLDVKFEAGTISGFEIPREALVDGHSVYVLKGSKLEKIKVNVLRHLDDSYLIDGVSADMAIVTESLASVSSNVEYKSRK